MSITSTSAIAVNSTESTIESTPPPASETSSPSTLDESTTDLLGFPNVTSSVIPASPTSIDIQFASASAFPSPIAVSSSSSSGPSSHGSVVAAAVGGSVGAVVAIVLGFAVLWFQLKRRERSGGAWHPFFDSTTSSSESLAPTLERRFASLEKEVASLRAEVTRLSARERGRGGGLVARGPSLIYTREKANEALRDPRRESDKSSVPPLYGD